eukprot:CAMPEP_0184505322 /NCGR_PEP_ID=MMETSP0113_2-20130426/52925_1 /TAXON_ID=91329 /ORGANISM="Norrisiella sphaerica, Strain BC52" /LENGTH=1036 /DNA_ID=CAMNT_0026895009 /DNA_START=321 /DNA_END=3431 /DNA_ORIENTATION=+
MVGALSAAAFAVCIGVAPMTHGAIVDQVLAVVSTLNPGESFSEDFNDIVLDTSVSGSLQFYSTGVHAIRRISNIDISTQTADITQISGANVAGSQDGNLLNARYNVPWGIAIGSQSPLILYVADRDNHRIRKVSITGDQVTTLVGSSNGGSMDGGFMVAAFNSPRGIAINTQIGQDHLIYVSTEHEIRLINVVNQMVTTIAGSATAGSNDGLGTLAAFFSPASLAFSNTRDALYIADEKNNLIRKLNLTVTSGGGEVTRVAGNGGGGSSNEDGLLLNAMLNGPSAIEVDRLASPEVVYCSDQLTGRLRVISLATGMVTSIGAPSDGFTELQDGSGVSARFGEIRGLASASEASRDLLFATDTENKKFRVITNLQTEAPTSAPAIGFTMAPSSSRLLSPSPAPATSAPLPFLGTLTVVHEAFWANISLSIVDEEFFRSTMASHVAQLTGVEVTRVSIALVSGSVVAQISTVFAAGAQTASCENFAASTAANSSLLVPAAIINIYGPPSSVQATSGTACAIEDPTFTVEDEGDNAPVIIGVVVGVVVLALLAGLCCYCYMCGRLNDQPKKVPASVQNILDHHDNDYDVDVEMDRTMDNSMPSKDGDMRFHASMTALRRSHIAAEEKSKTEFKELLRAAEPRLLAPADIEIGKKIGDGFFSEVFLCRLKRTGGSAVLKVPKAQQTSADVTELQTLMSLKPHPNVLEFIGVTPMDGKLCFIAAYCRMGSLESLHKSLDLASEVPFLRICLDASRGLAHLHSIPIVHRDLACRNLLMKEDGAIVISDYGLSRIVSDGVYTQDRSKTAWQWIAPESMAEGRFSLKSDIWMLGVTFWEILNKGARPYGEFGFREAIAGIISGSIRLNDNRGGSVGSSSPPGHQPPSISISLIDRCLAKDEKSRPSADELVRCITEYQDTEAYKKALDFYNASRNELGSLHSVDLGTHSLHTSSITVDVKNEQTQNAACKGDTDLMHSTGPRGLDTNGKGPTELTGNGRRDSIRLGIGGRAEVKMSGPQEWSSFYKVISYGDLQGKVSRMPPSM